MLPDRDVRASVAIGLVAVAVAIGYGVLTDLIRAPAEPGLATALLVDVTLVVVPFALGTGTAFLALRHRVVLPLALVAVFAALPGLLGWHGGSVLVGVLGVGPLVVTVALLETLVRVRLGRLAAPPSARGLRALSVGVGAAVVYFGVFALRAIVPLWRIDTGVPQRLAPGAELALTLWYVLGISLVLVGLPVALNRRVGLVAPLVGIVAYLLIDLAFVQPAVAEGTELVVALLLSVWPTLSVLLATVGGVEFWIRRRRGEYDREEGDGEDDGKQDDGPTVEGGLFGDRV